MNIDVCILVTGEDGVGKTELIKSFSRSAHIVEANSEICRLRVKNTMVTFHIQEISSGDFFNQSLAKTRVDIILLCFDIIKPSSLDALLIKSSASSNLFSDKVPRLLIGCKSDLVTHTASVSVSRLRALHAARRLGAVLYVETEAVKSASSSIATFEAAALTAMGHFKAPTIHNQVCRSRSRDQSSSEFWNKFLYPQRVGRLREKSSSLNSLMSIGRRPSVPEISTIDTTNKHLKASRSKSYNTREENSRVIKCERLNKEKIIEEIDLLIPFSIYERLGLQ